jgi:peptidoglycan/xylan/chitin deacetylase (PgdA/CDA1 family)
VDNYEHAFPLLSKYKAPATFFLTVGYLDRDPAVMQRFQFFARGLTKPEPLSWQQVREMAGSGMKIEAHTYSHANLSYLRADELEFEIKECKKLLEDRIGQAVEGFAYPFGMPRCHFDRQAQELVQEAKYSYAVTTVNRGLRRWDSPWALPRLTIRDDEIPTLADKVSGIWDLLGHFNEWGPKMMARMVSPRGFHESTYG